VCKIISRLVTIATAAICLGMSKKNSTFVVVSLSFLFFRIFEIVF
jgi:hypothetical protein